MGELTSSDIPNRILVTGGGSGIGLAVVKRLIEQGSKVIAIGRSRNRLDAAQAFGASVFVHDVADDPGPLFERIEPVNGLVLNAGVQIRRSAREWTQRDWQQLLATNLVGAAMMTQHFIQRQSGPASIVGVASTLARMPAPCTGAYAASKAGLIAMLETVALEEAPRQIRANIVLPGIVDTEMINPDQAWTESVKNKLEAVHPLNRLGTATEVAEVIVDVLMKKWMTGSKVAIDGGLMLGKASE
jgi:3-oxoacyl-[acyl-carrier protein] reductase